MTLNWTPEVIVDFIVATIILLCAILTYTSPRTRKIISLFYIRLGILFMAFYFYLEAFSFLFMNTFLAIVYAVLIFPVAFFLLMGITYTMREDFYSLGLIFIFGLGLILCYLAFQPNVVKPTIEMGYPTILQVGLFEIIGNLFLLITTIILFYWGLKTRINAPFLIKKEANVFFVGINFISIFSLIIYMFSFWIPILVLLSDLILALGLIIVIYSIIRQPKLLYILPFTIHRILVKDKEGYPLFDHDWSESNISEVMFTGFINAVQLMSNEVINRGGLIDINLDDGILIMLESELITVGLVASKSSKLLRESLKNFSEEFQQNFERELKKSIKDMSVYEPAYLLIDKYFSNFPFKIILSEKQPLFLSGKYSKIPLELDNKLKDIFEDEKAYEFIKSEIAKSPKCIPEIFLNLYDNLKEERDKLSDEDSEDSEDSDLKLFDDE